MRHDDNRTELFKMLAESITNLDTGETTIIVTSLRNVATNTVRLTYQLCNHATMKKFWKVTIVTVDKDVTVIALYHFLSLKLEELLVELGVGQHHIWLPKHKYATVLKEEVCRALPFWFTVTGCDKVSMLAG